MPYEMNTIDGDLDIICIEISGEILFQEISGIMDDYFANTHRRILIDLRGSNFGIISRAEIVRIIKRFKDPTVTHSEKAAVVSTSDEDLGLVMLMKNMGTVENIPTSYRIFRDRDQAVEWLRS
jgi:hypothetical protein